jgi:hypothetical protein
VTNLRERIEADLEGILEDYQNGFALPVILIAPDGVKQEFSANDPDVPRTIPLTGRVTYARFDIDPDTGLPLRIDNPIVTLRRSSLDRIPLAGELWSVQIPKKPAVDAEKETYVTELPPRDGRSFGWIQLPLTLLEQGV